LTHALFALQLYSQLSVVFSTNPWSPLSASAASVRPAKFKKKLSTRIASADLLKFQETFAARMSGDMDGLKRKRVDAKDKVQPFPPLPTAFISVRHAAHTVGAGERRQAR
jgi:hypothetical protein